MRAAKVTNDEIKTKRSAFSSALEVVEKFFINNS